MTKQEIEAVLDRVRSWPHERQEEAAAALLDIEATDDGTYFLTDEERADVRAGVAEADRGEFAPADRIRALLTPRG